MKAEDVARLLLEAGRWTFPDEASDVDGSELLALLNERERTVFIEFANLVEEHARAPLEACPDCHDGSACLPGGCGVEGCERCGQACPTCGGSCEIDPAKLLLRVRALKTENKKLTEAISAFQKAWNEEDDQAVNDAFDALGDAKHPSVLRALGLPPEGGAS